MTTPLDALKGQIPPDMLNMALGQADAMKSQMFKFMAAKMKGKVKTRWAEFGHPQGIVDFINEKGDAIVVLGIVPNFQSYSFFLIYEEFSK